MCRPLVLGFTILDPDSDPKVMEDQREGKSDQTGGSKGHWYSSTILDEMLVRIMFGKIQ